MLAATPEAIAPTRKPALVWVMSSSATCAARLASRLGSRDTSTISRPRTPPRALNSSIAISAPRRSASACRENRPVVGAVWAMMIGGGGGGAAHTPRVVSSTKTSPRSARPRWFFIGFFMRTSVCADRATIYRFRKKMHQPGKQINTARPTLMAAQFVPHGAHRDFCVSRTTGLPSATAEGRVTRTHDQVTTFLNHGFKS